ncbi:MAG TPA: YCF48-related protein [Ignavibacteria bacterium]
MKKIIFVIAINLLTVSTIFSQSGWITQSVPANLFLNTIYFINAETGYTVGSDYIYGNFVFGKTTNGGTNWIIQYSATNTMKNPMSLFFTDALTGYSVGGDAWLNNPACFFKTVNGGVNWISSYFQDTTVYRAVYFPNSNTGFVAGSFGYLLKTTDAGNSWIHLNSGTTNSFLSICFLDVNTGFITGSNGTILKTINSGSNWITQISNTTKPLRSIHFENNFTGYVCGYDGNDYSSVSLKTTNSGENWLVLFNEPTTASTMFRSIFFTSPEEGFIAASGRVLKTTNGGTNWNYLDLPPCTWIGTSIYFVNSLTGFICGGTGYNVSTILKTTNAGISIIPSPPTGLTGYFYKNPRRIILSWNDNSYIEDGYKIERKKTSDTSWALIDSVLQNITQYTDARLDSEYNICSYRIYAYNSNGRSEYSNIISVITTDVTLLERKIIIEYSLSQNYPNPFNPVTRIKFQITSDVKRKTSDVKLIIYDILGKEIIVLVNEQLKPGIYESTFDGSNLPSGVYFYQLKTGNFLENKKMLLIK